MRKLNSSLFKSVATISVVVLLIYLVSTIKSAFGNSEEEKQMKDENDAWLNEEIKITKGSILKLTNKQVLEISEEIKSSVRTLFGLKIGSEEELYRSWGKIKSSADFWRVAQSFQELYGISIKNYLGQYCSIKQLNTIIKISKLWN